MLTQTLFCTTGQWQKDYQAHFSKPKQNNTCTTIVKRVKGKHLNPYQLVHLDDVQTSTENFIFEKRKKLFFSKIK